MTGAILCRRVSQNALRGGPDSGVAGLHRPGRVGDEGLRKPQRCVRVEGLRQGGGLGSEGLVVQIPGETQVPSVLVHTAHVSAANIWHGAALVHIWNTESSDEAIPALTTSLTAICSWWGAFCFSGIVLQIKVLMIGTGGQHIYSSTALKKNDEVFY